MSAPNGAAEEVLVDDIAYMIVLRRRMQWPILLGMQHAIQPMQLRTSS